MYEQVRLLSSAAGVAINSWRSTLWFLAAVSVDGNIDCRSASFARRLLCLFQGHGDEGGSNKIWPSTSVHTTTSPAKHDAKRRIANLGQTRKGSIANTPVVPRRNNCNSNRRPLASVLRVRYTGTAEKVEEQSGLNSCKYSTFRFPQCIGTTPETDHFIVIDDVLHTTVLSF